MRKLWAKVPEAWKVLTVMAAVFAVGATAGGAVHDVAGTPAKLQAHIRAFDTLTTRVDAVDDAVVDTRRMVEELLCLSLAERNETLNWRECIR